MGGLGITLVSTPLRIWRALRNIGNMYFYTKYNSLYITLEVLQNTNVYIVYSIFFTHDIICMCTTTSNILPSIYIFH